MPCALDKKKSATGSFLSVPTINAHLVILSRLRFALLDPDFRSELTVQGSREEIFSALNAADQQLV